jgi:hypothetical protein
LLLFNGHFDPVEFRLPSSEKPWEEVISSKAGKINRPVTGDLQLCLGGRSFVLMCQKHSETPLETAGITTSKQSVKHSEHKKTVKPHGSIKSRA